MTQGKLKQPDKIVDIAVLIRQLKHTTGKSWRELSEETGFSSSFLQKIVSEEASPETVLRSINLLALFIRNTSKDIPYIGEYHQ